MRVEQTLYDGPALYRELFGFWTRDGATANLQDSKLFPDWHASQLARRQFRKAIAPKSAETWDIVDSVWRFCAKHAAVDSKAYGEILDEDGDQWPGLGELWLSFAEHKKLFWSACFSKAHTFLWLLCACGVNPSHAAIASTRYAKDQLAEHQYITVYDEGRWWFLDPKETARIKTLGARRDVPGVFPSKYKPDWEHPNSCVFLPGTFYRGAPLIGAETEE